MSWKLGLNVGEAMVEITASRNGETHSRFFLLPRRDFKGPIRDFLAALPEVSGSTMSIATDLATWILRRRLGTPIALLVTAGFEDWPQLRQPVLEADFRVGVKRTPAFLDPSYIFGVTERIRADGQIETPLESTELEFLASKLDLSGIKQVAVGFLNSQVNPDHEKNAAEFLQSKGFEVYVSSEFTRHTQEVARWWRAFLSAYLASNFGDFEKEILEICDSLQIQPFLVHSRGMSPLKDNRDYLDSAMGLVHGLSRWTDQKNCKTLLYMGFEGFTLLRTDQTRETWNTRLGPVALPHTMTQRLAVQPTSPILEGLFHAATFGEHELHFDPGPMLAGRGLQLTAFDTWCVADPDLLKIFPYESAEAMVRVHSVMHTLAKKLGMNSEELAHEILSLTRALVDEELARIGWPEPLAIAGPLTSLAPARLQEFVLKVPFLASQALVGL